VIFLLIFLSNCKKVTITLQIVHFRSFPIISASTGLKSI
jgi:hypothetical protein